MKHHPDIELLLKYSSGHLKPSLALAIGLHHQDCKKCQQQIDELESIGGEALETMPEDIKQQKFDDSEFDKLFNNIKNLPQDIESEEFDSLALAQSDIPIVDQLNHQRFQEFSWKRLSPKIWTASIAMNDPHYEVELLKFSANTKIPIHTHKGNEYTLVLQGDFSDHQGNYSKGEFIVQDQSVEHQPVAGEDGCICLAVTDAPLKFTGTFGPILNWFIR